MKPAACAAVNGDREMNVGNILKVADAIEQASVPGLGFNMLNFRANGRYEDKSGHHCGTTACIAGWAVAVEGTQLETPWLTCDNAIPFLGVNPDQARELFYASRSHEVRLSKITPTEAVRCLRILAITGKVDWAAAMKGDEPTLPALPVNAKRVEA